MLSASDIGLPLGPVGTAALMPANLAAYAEGVERPEDEVRLFVALREGAHQRLFGHVPWLRAHLVDAVDQVDHVAVLLLAPAGRPEEAPVGVGRMIRYTGDPATADIALAVADDWQGRGVGSALARALVAHRPLGVTRLVTVVAAGNRASLATLAGLGAVDRTLTDGVYGITVTLPT